MAREFTISERLLKRQKHTMTSTFTLESVRDYLLLLRGKQQPVDFNWSLRETQVRFDHGVMRVYHTEHRSGPLLVTKVGAGQLAREVLPSRFWAGFRQLAHLDPRLAQEVWARFAKEVDLTRVIRTVQMRRDRTVHRVIRASVSETYGMYSHLEFIEDLLQKAGDLAHLPVLDWWLTDNGMRIRFAGVDLAASVFMQLDEKVAVGSVVPMVEVWNSEVGLRRVGMYGGLFNLHTLCGFGHWDDAQSHGWVHRGSASRIRREVRSAFQEMVRTGEEVVEAYKEAEEVEIEDLDPWLGATKVPPVIAAKAKAWLREQQGQEPGAPLPGTNLARVIDAVTVAAQPGGAADLSGGEAADSQAAWLLATGLGRKK